MPNYARLLAGFGECRAKRMLLLGELLSAEEARMRGSSPGWSRLRRWMTR